MDKGTLFYKNTWNIRGKLFSFPGTMVMGILNTTPDSFYDGGRYKTDHQILAQAEKMVAEGASIIDVGGCSTRPGSENVSEEEELKRVLSTISLLKNKFPEHLVSVDTFSSVVAKMAVEEGADLVNDISGGTMDERMFKTVSELKVPYILTHIQGTPNNMQENPHYKNVTQEIFRYFGTAITKLLELGVTDIILDPGFGFGKNTAHNFELLKNLSVFTSLGYPVMAGFSRKSMINKVIKTKPKNALNGTTVLNTIALRNGVSILRVHDVKEAVEAVELVNFLHQNPA